MSIVAAPERLRDRRGFSLIELVLVLGILATMTAIAIPRWGRSMDRYRADLAAHRIATDLSYARREARAVSGPRTVRFDILADTYTLVGIGDPDRPSTSYVVRLDEDPHRVAIISATFDNPSNLDQVDELVFDAWGAPDSGGTVVIGAGPETRTVVLDPDTGKAAVQ